MIRDMEKESINDPRVIDGNNNVELPGDFDGGHWFLWTRGSSSNEFGALSNYAWKDFLLVKGSEIISSKQRLHITERSVSIYMFLNLFYNLRKFGKKFWQRSVSLDWFCKPVSWAI